MLAITVFGPRYLLEASKSLPKASREPPKSRSRALKKHPRAAENRLGSSQEASKRLPFWGPSHLQLHFVSLQIALQDLLIQPSQAPARAMVSCSFYPDISNVSIIMGTIEFPMNLRFTSRLRSSLPMGGPSSKTYIYIYIYHYMRNG